jgi:hypothetical protein
MAQQMQKYKKNVDTENQKEYRKFNVVGMQAG